MRKLLFSAAAIAALSFSSVADASAQVIKGFYKQSYKARNNGTFDKGTGIFSIGLGAPYAYGGYRNTLPPIYAKYEMGIMDEVGIGIVGGLGLGKNRYSDEGYFGTVVGLLGYYHFNKFIPLQKLDVYAGVGFGFDIHNRTYNGDTEADVLPLFKVGARYYFSNSFGVYLESGYDRLSAANLGITLRF